KKIPDDQFKSTGMVWVFSKEGTVVVKQKGKKDQKGTYRLDPTKKPGAIDLVKEGGKTLLGLYRLEGDHLTICTYGGDAGKKRPDRFASEPGSGLFLLILKREKP